MADSYPVSGEQNDLAAAMEASYADLYAQVALDFPGRQAAAAAIAGEQETVDGEGGKLYSESVSPITDKTRDSADASRGV